MNNMEEIVICKHCGRPEYYGKMRWLDGKCSCRACYKSYYEDKTGQLYAWSDLNGRVPTMEDFEQQNKGGKLI